MRLPRPVLINRFAAIKKSFIMKVISFILLAGALMAASVVNIFDELEFSRDDAGSKVIESFGRGILVTDYDIVKKARSLPESVQVEGARQLVRYAREYTESPEFKKTYSRWRDEQLGYKQKKKGIGIPNPMKMLDKAIDKQLNKGDDDKKYPADPAELIKKRLQSFMDVSATVDFDATLNGSQFANPEYEKKSDQWKMCYRAGKAVITAAREEVAQWLKELQ
jgi:hypothetical protein